VSFEPTDEWGFCPACGAAGVDVDAARDDYYLGPIYRCANGHGFYVCEADPTPARAPSGPPGPFEEFLRSVPVAPVYSRQSILLSELASRPAGVTFRVPIVRGEP
jgi:hypothetical protein